MIYNKQRAINYSVLVAQTSKMKNIEADKTNR